MNLHSRSSGQEGKLVPQKSTPMVSEKTADVIRRATQFYEERLRGKLERTHWNDFVAIEPDSGAYYFGKTLSEAIQSARAAYPDRLVYAMRIGHSAAVHLGVLNP